MPCFDLLIEKERVERKLRESEDAHDIDAFNFWYIELKRICDIIEFFPCG